MLLLSTYQHYYAMIYFCARGRIYPTGIPAWRKLPGRACPTPDAGWRTTERPPKDKARPDDVSSRACRDSCLRCYLVQTASRCRAHEQRPLAWPVSSAWNEFPLKSSVASPVNVMSLVDDVPLH